MTNFAIAALRGYSALRGWSEHGESFGRRAVSLDIDSKSLAESKFSLRPFWPYSR